MVGSLVLTQFSSPVIFAHTARTCLRILSLNIAFNGAVNYGVGSALYEVSSTQFLRRKYSRQIMFSLLPGAASFGITEYLLLCSEITPENLIGSFALLSLVQIISFISDRRLVRNEQLPKWYLLVKIPIFIYTILLTAFILAAMYSKLDVIQKKNDNKRIETLKYLMELDDVQFLKKVNELNIQYDEEDLQILEKQYMIQQQ